MITHLIKTSYFVLKLPCSTKSLIVQLLIFIGVCKISMQDSNPRPLPFLIVIIELF